MSYTVVWHPRAENELAAVWMASADRPAVTAAAAELDRRLAADGPEVGESRPVGRIAFERPLGILFDVDEVRGVVVVGQVWEFH